MRKELVILVDCLEEASIDHMQNSALLSFGCLAALHSLPPHDAGLFNVGLCAIHKQPNGRDVQLKVASGIQFFCMQACASRFTKRICCFRASLSYMLRGIATDDRGVLATGAAAAGPVQPSGVPLCGAETACVRLAWNPRAA